MTARASRIAGIAAIVAAGCFATPSLGGSGEPLANIGTLTCVADPASREPLGVERQLSCTFRPILGPEAQLVGHVKRIGGQIPGQAKIVLAWTVMAPDLDTDSAHLEGRYVGDLGAERGDDSIGMVGGTDGSIALRPLTVAPEVGTNAAPTVLELELAAMKA